MDFSNNKKEKIGLACWRLGCRKLENKRRNVISMPANTKNIRSKYIGTKMLNINEIRALLK